MFDFVQMIEKFPEIGNFVVMRKRKGHGQIEGVVVSPSSILTDEGEVEFSIIEYKDWAMI